MGEGHHLYRINGKYFDVSAIPGHTRIRSSRADSMDGPWEVERMVRSESLGVPTQNSVRGGRRDNSTFAITHSDPNSGGGLTIHQGGIVDTLSGQWWSIIMQDHGSIGRMVRWSQSRGKPASRLSVCQATSVSRPTPGSNRTRATVRILNRCSSAATASIHRHSVLSGSGITSPMTRGGPSPRSRVCCAAFVTGRQLLDSEEQPDAAANGSGVHCDGRT